MKKLITLLLIICSCSVMAQIDTASTVRTPPAGFAPKIVTDRFLRASSMLAIPFVSSTTPSMNGAVNRQGYGLQLLSNNRLAIGIGSSAFSQYMTVTELGTTYATITNLALKLNIANPAATGTFTTPALNVSGATASTIASFDASKNLVSLATATYPSLTELTYVKGLTSAAQTQINTNSTAIGLKANLTTNTFSGLQQFGLGAQFNSATSARFYNAANTFFTNILPTTITANRAITLPDASGVIALTSNLSSYAPYTGATSNLDIGVYNFTAGGVTINGALQIKDNWGMYLFNPSSVYSVQIQAPTLTANRNVSFPDKTGIVALTSDLANKADLASPSLTGNPTAPTQSPGNNSTRIATTAYVDAAVSGGGGSAGTYTPTMTNISGTSSITARKARYTRIGNIVTVFGSFDVQNSASGFSLSISLPVSSNLGSQYDLSGNSNSGVDKMGILSADVTNDVAIFSATFGTTGASIPMYYSFSYEVI